MKPEHEAYEAAIRLMNAIEDGHPEGVNQPVSASNRERWNRLFATVLYTVSLDGETDPDILAEIRKDAEALTATLEQRSGEYILFAWDG